MTIDEATWDFFQQHLGYSDDEMKRFRENPRNTEILEKSRSLMEKTIVVEVVESRGCNSRHHVGDKFYFNGAGNLITQRCEKDVCIFALNAMASLIYGVHELFYAGVDPNELRFKRAGCFDVGVECGGWGNIVMEISVEDAGT